MGSGCVHLRQASLTNEMAPKVSSFIFWHTQAHTDTFPSPAHTPPKQMVQAQMLMQDGIGPTEGSLTPPHPSRPITPSEENTQATGTNTADAVKDTLRTRRRVGEVVMVEGRKAGKGRCCIKPQSEESEERGRGI